MKKNLQCKGLTCKAALLVLPLMLAANWAGAACTNTPVAYTGNGTQSPSGSFSTVFGGTDYSYDRFDLFQRDTGLDKTVATVTWPITTAPTSVIGFQMNWSNNNVISNAGRAATMEVRYNGKAYFRIVTDTHDAADKKGYVTPVQGSDTLFDASGNAINSTVILNQRSGGTAWTQYYIKLLPGEATNGTITYYFADADPGTAKNDNDDIGYLAPTIYRAGVCVSEQVASGTVPQSYSVTSTNTTPASETVAVSGLNTSYPATATIRYLNDLSQPVTLTSDNTGSSTPNRVSSVSCSQSNSLPTALQTASAFALKPIDVSATPTGNADITLHLSNFAAGATADCTITNTNEAYPLITVHKKVDNLYASADSFTFGVSGGDSSNTKSSTTNGTGTFDGGPWPIRSTYTTTTSSATNTSITENALPALTINETAASGSLSHYTSSYSCSNTGGITPTAFSTAGTASSITVTPNYNNQISCTFINLPAPKTTTINTSKTGTTYVTQGQTLSYTVEVDVPAAAANDASNVVITDTLPTDTTFVSATGNPTSAPAVGDNGKIVWTVPTLSKGSSASYNVVVTAPSATGVAGSQSLVTNTLTNKVDVTSSTPTDSASTLSATKTSYVLFAGINKQVRNVTTKGSLANSAAANPGDILEYCLNYTNYSGAPLDSLTIKDTLQNGQTLVAGGEGSGDIKVTRNGTVTYAANTDTITINQPLPNVALNETGSVCFQAQVPLN